MKKWSAARAATVVALALAAIVPVDAAEYLNVEAPIPDSLDDTLSATESIGVTPESTTTPGHEPSLTPSLLLPYLRERIPKSGIAFIDDAKFSVQPRLYHRYRNNNGEEFLEATAIGGALSYESGWIANFFRLTLVGYTSQRLYSRPGSGDTGLLRPGAKGYTVLGQVFGELKYGESSTFFGRLALNAPFINGNDSRMVPNTFEGVGVRSTAIENLQLAIAYISGIKGRTASQFIPMSEKAGAEGSNSGVSAIAFRYNFSDDFNVGGVNQYGWNTFNTVFFQSDYTMNFNDDLSLRLGGQFTDQRSVGDALVGRFNTQSLGAEAALGYRSFIARTAFTWTARGSGIRKPWGGSPSFNSTMISDFDREGEKAIRAGFSWDLSHAGVEGLGVALNWLYGDTPDHSTAGSSDQQEFNVTVDYRPPIEALDSFWFRVRYAENHKDDGFDRQEFRVTLNYSYSF